MLKEVLLVIIISMIAQKTYRYYNFMGYARVNDVINYEHGECSQKFKNITPGEFKKPIFNTLDADMLPNGLAIFLSSNQHPLLENLHKSLNDSSETTNEPIRSTVFMLDMNHVRDSEPFAIKIINKNTNLEIDPDYFNLYALSMYQDKFGTLKFLAANYITDSMKSKYPSLNQENHFYTIERFSYHAKKHYLEHSNTFVHDSNFGELCDLVVIDESLFYFTKCHSKLSPKDINLNLEIRNGEIWVFNLNDKVAYPVAKKLLMPKSIGYLKSKGVIVVSNLATDGLTLFKREFDNSLTKLQDISLNSFVFSINIDFSSNIWLTLHPILYQTLSLTNSIESYTSSKLVQLNLDFRYSQFVNYELNEYFSSNGTSSFNAISASIVHRNYFVLFSLKNDPRVCSIKLLNKVI